MKLKVAALAIAGGLLWGACVFCVALANLAMPNYGVAFLNTVAALYPGYHGGAGFGSVLLGTAYALVDGAIGGALFGWLYNVVVASSRESAGSTAAANRASHHLGHHAH
jgi:hypothetical protein